MNLDLNDIEFINNPYPTYKKLRELNEPIWIKQAEGISNVKSILLFSRYEDALEIYKESKKISNNMFRVREFNEKNLFFNHMMGSDGEKHKRLRSSVSDYFKVSHLEQIKPIISNLCNDLAIEIINKGKNGEDIDLVNDYAEKIPILVIANLLGMTDCDLIKMRKWSKTISRGIDTISATLEDTEKTKIAIQEFMTYLKEYISYKKNHPKDSMIGHLISLEKNKVLSENELISMVSFLFVAGHETTINSIGNGLWLLLSHPEQLEMIKNDKSLLSNAVEEIFRFESPIQRSSFRMSVEPVIINGFSIDPETQISIAIGSANRDENIFKNPEKFDILRTPNPHIAFGAGVHNCLGKHLARIEASLSIECFIKNFPNLELLSSKPNWDGRSLLRGLKDLKVKSNSWYNKL